MAVFFSNIFSISSIGKSTHVKGQAKQENKVPSQTSRAESAEKCLVLLLKCNIL